VSRKPTELLADDKLKKRGSRTQRQANRRDQILSRTSSEDTKPPSVYPTREVEQDKKDKNEEKATPGTVRAPGIMNSRASTGVQEDDLKMAAVESKQEVEQDKDEENPTPGTVWVSGVNSRDSTGVQEDDVKMAAVETMQENRLA
jgi:hypothetical protein